MELRKDYILDRWVLISTGRSKRPSQFKEKSEKVEPKTCYFCPGMEKTTPPEIGRLGTKKKWTVRWIPNKFPAVKNEGNPVIDTHNNYYTFASGFGYHEIIIETNDHKKQFSDLSPKQIKDVLSVYQMRIKELSKKDDIQYVSVFKNHGKKGGTSILHSHSQIIAYNHLPRFVKMKLDAINNYNHCPYCDIINREKDSDRHCFENNHFIAFTPYASRFNFEIWIFSKDHAKNITQFDDKQLLSLAKILKNILVKLKSINSSYNLALYYSPDDADLHFHIEVLPRLSTFAGFELQTGDIINIVSPEQAAEFYRGKK